MANFKKGYNISDKIRQIQGKISANSTLNNFINNKQSYSYFNNNNKDNQNIIKVLSDILVSLVGSQEKLKSLLVSTLTTNLPTIEHKIKKIIKQYSFQLISCGIDARLNVPYGVINESVSTFIPEEKYPYIEQYDFYGLFAKDINDPIQNLRFDRNLNTFIKTNIDAQNTTFTWQNSDNIDVVQFTYYEPQERILVGPPVGTSWGVNGITMKSFIDLYIDSINLFPPESILKDLLDSVFNIKEGSPYDIDLDFLTKLLFNQCNCKTTEEDRSRSTFDLTYDDFVADKNNEADATLMTNLKFGPVDAPIPSAITPAQPNLDSTYLNTIKVLQNNTFNKANRNDRERQISEALNQIEQDQHQQTNNLNNQLNVKFAFKPNLNADVNLKMLLMLPAILTTPLFSPKLTMFFGIIYKRYYINDTTHEDIWKTKNEYYDFIGEIIKLVIKDIMSFLLKTLFNYIKKEITKLIKQIVIQILSEKLMGYINQIKSLINIFNMLKGMIPPTLPRISFNNCQSILDGIVSLFDIVNTPPGLTLPPGMSMIGMSKTGLSPTSVTQSAVEKMNNMGLNVNAMPDGTPNPNVVIASALSSAMVEQIQQTARIQVSTVGVGFAEGGGTIT